MINILFTLRMFYLKVNYRSNPIENKNHLNKLCDHDTIQPI
jgi:hypothetical protein